jgi:small subunit ribosomal protein S17
MNQKNKRQFVGEVVSDKMDKTRVVVVSSFKKHKVYKKIYKVSKKFKVHDEKNEYHNRDTVLIEETNPISKYKMWKIVKKISSPKKIENVDEIKDE